MRFLALTGLQTLLLAGITAGAIIALYFLKLRHRRVVIASSMLWGRVLDEMQAQSLWEKLRRLISIAIAVLIGLLIALAIARPEVHWLTGGGERTLLVLDTSPTMLARRSDGRTRWEHAVEAALRHVNSSAPSSEFRVADTAGRVDSPFTSDRRAIRRSIERMRPIPGKARVPEPDSEAVVVRFITDGVVQTSVPQDATIQSVFEDAENVGITAFEIRSMPASPLAYEAYLEIHNYGHAPRTVALTIAGAGRRRVDREIELKPGGEFGGPFDLSGFEGGVIRATAQAGGDAFTPDDTAYAYLPVERKTRTLLITEGNTYLETILSLDAFVELTTIRRERYRDGADFDVYVFDGFVPPSPPSRPALFVGGIPGAGLPRQSGRIASPRFGSWLEDHPVMQFVSLHDVSVDSAYRVDAGDALVLAETEDGAPLILASRESQYPRWVLLTFSLQGSDFPLHPGFPLFIDNALGWFSREPLALRRQIGLVRVPRPGVRIKALDGADVPSHSQKDATIFEAAEPGLYSASDGNSRQYIAVNLGSRLYSNVNGAPSPESRSAGLVSGWLEQELWFYMLCAAGVLAAGEWLTYHRRITL